MTQEVNNGFRHVLPIQIRFNDVDKFGHVNNTVYFQFYDTARSIMMYAHRFSLPPIEYFAQS